jgi:hypothetical protein
MNSDILYTDEYLFLRDDIASGIVIDGKAQFSVISKKPYCRLAVYCMSKERALIKFKKNYLDFLEEIISLQREEKRHEII